MTKIHCKAVSPCGYRNLNERGKYDIGKKGQIPVMVGLDIESMEGFWIPAKLIKHRYIVGLLEMSAIEFGYSQSGTLKLPCEVGCFKTMIHLISKGK